jgi:hypothetical protein
MGVKNVVISFELIWKSNGLLEVDVGLVVRGDAKSWKKFTNPLYPQSPYGALRFKDKAGDAAS